MNISLQNLGPAVVAAFLVVGGLGAASSVGRAPDGTATPANRHSGDDMLVRLEDYARASNPGVSLPSAGEELLPDVDTMISGLATRLASAPADVKGWRMLGWSYFNTGRFAEAAAAYRKALDLDPGSAELRRFHDEAAAKAAPARRPEPDHEEGR